jgi:flagellar basal-body rod protein FlgF
MEYKDGISWAADAMLACNDRLEVANQNLANAASRNFHTVLDRIVMTPDGLRAIHTQTSGSGPQRSTGRTLDLAIDGDGAFRVSDPANPGNVTETRNGAFSLDKDGYLADPTGKRLVGEDGKLVKATSSDVQVRGDGTILDSGKTIGKIPLVDGTLVRSGFLEISNVDSAQMMISMIDAQRSFETAEKALSSVDSARQKSADEVARLKG